MDGFGTPADLIHNRGLTNDTAAFPRDHGAASGLFLCGEAGPRSSTGRQAAGADFEGSGLDILRGR